MSGCANEQIWTISSPVRMADLPVRHIQSEGGPPGPPFIADREVRVPG